MAIQVNNGVTNVKGTPGIISGALADIPAVETTPLGTLYFSYTDSTIYQNLDNSIWFVIASAGGGGSTPTLQQVTTAGATTTDNIFVLDNLGAQNVITPDLIQVYNSTNGYTASLENITVPKCALVYGVLFSAELDGSQLLFTNLQTSFQAIFKADYAHDSILFGDAANENVITINATAANERIYFTAKTPRYNFANVPAYTDNAAALAAGLIIGDIYRHEAGGLESADQLRIVH